MSTAYLIAGLAYGDEGKGATVDFLTRMSKSGLIIRYNGGPQAAHNVITPDGRHHTFSQFGSGMFVPDVKTHLSRFMLINPLNMMCENEHLQQVGITDALNRITVERECVVITPYQILANRILEMSRAEGRHGSCGQGIGETRSDHLTYGEQVLFAGDLWDPKKTRDKLEFLREVNRNKVRATGITMLYNGNNILIEKDSSKWLADEYSRWPVSVQGQPYLKYEIERHDVVIFEGAQGMMIDETHGEAPYNTWTDCTFNNAETLLKECEYEGDVVKIGVVRSYYTRHGVGPFPTEDESIKVPIELHNGTNEYQGSFRKGRFDGKAFLYALEKIGDVDYAAVNHLDYMKDKSIKTIAGVPIGICGYGPTAKDRRFNL